MAVHEALNYVVFQWHSKYAPHKMTVPTRPWISTIGGGADGGYHAWDGSDIAALDMVNTFVTLWAPIFPVTSFMDRFTIYQKTGPGAIPVPFYDAALAVAGSSVATGWDEATQHTFVMRTSAFNFVKLVTLDVATDNAFGKYYTLISPYDAWIANFMDPSQAWAGRDSSQPARFVSVAVDLNDRLRREYHIK